MFKNEQLEQLVKELGVLEPSTYQPWFSADAPLRLAMLAAAIATGHVKFDLITPENCFHVPSNTLIEEIPYEEEDDDTPYYFIPDNFYTQSDSPPHFQIIQDGDATSRLHIIKEGLELGRFMINGPSFRKWFRGFCRPTHYQPDKKKELLMFDIIHDCSNSLYPDGRDGDFDQQVERERIEEWLKYNIIGHGNSAYFECLITAINPAKSKKGKKTIKYSWDQKTFESYIKANPTFGDRKP